MNIADELRKLQELHRSGGLTDAEFAAAKAAVLGHGTAAPENAVMREHLEEIKRQNDVAQLDREWEMERERLLIYGNNRYGRGYSYVPSKGIAIFMGVITVGFGAFWTAMAASMAGGVGGPGAFFPLFGLIFIAAGVGMSIYTYTKATQYEQAHRAYQSRRARMLTDTMPTTDFSDEPTENIQHLDAEPRTGEDIECLGCGKMIPGDASACPSCGWSFVER